MLQRYSNESSKLVVGLMSGTSLDGIDAAIVRIEGSGYDAKAELVHFYSAGYEDSLRQQLKTLCTVEHSNVALVCGMNFYMGNLFADAALAAISDAGLSVQDIDLISTHGQTVWHIPQDDPNSIYLQRSTLQIGDISVIAKKTGIPVVGDFRTADMAVGGQGAPLAPYGDFVLFRHPQQARLLQNIGGIGNCAVIPAAAEPNQVTAFDTGPGNMVIDQVVYQLTNGQKTYDVSGDWAASGEVHMGLVSEMMQHPYFAMKPPKSTGRELFGIGYAAEFIAKARSYSLKDADIVATATAFTAHTIADSCKQHVLPFTNIDQIIVSGGGAFNKTLLRMLGELLPEQQVLTADEAGVSSDAKEAIIFALLGNDFMYEKCNNMPSATGASTATVMGKLALP
ncbi:anhydro-N-acetylmuramic acid kinase [Paenibacillus sp. IITD108]|uniref:anhydro-N-acetylmuramic acid kinase n=1 Tax=Paenibacillus sp. IITD108 TaxID=3116649 RepID=UPI002F428808